jgi:isoleucyl-tRNA synthetase
VLNPLWNTWHFFALYANAEGYQARFRTDSPALLDRYVLAKTRQLVERVQGALDSYEVAEACAHISAYLDALTNWYVRRSRDRFWGGDGTAGDRDASDTLYTVLHVVSRVCAPLLPYLCEDVYQGLTGERSVHLADWPAAAELTDDPDLVAAMDKVREVCSAGLSLREAHGLRVRLPLARLTVAGRAAELVRPFTGLIADELNVKQKVLKAAREGAWSAEPDGSVSVGGQTLLPGEFELALEARPGQATTALRGNDSVVNLDTGVTAELRAEGTARDLVRLVQQARKDAGLQVTDRITLSLHLTPEVEAAVRRHQAAVAEAVLATEGVFADHPQVNTAKLEGDAISFDVRPR